MGERKKWVERVKFQGSLNLEFIKTIKLRKEKSLPPCLKRALPIQDFFSLNILSPFLH